MNKKGFIDLEDINFAAAALALAAAPISLFVMKNMGDSVSLGLKIATAISSVIATYLVLAFGILRE